MSPRNAWGEVVIYWEIPGYRAVGAKAGRVRELATQGAEELFVTLIAVKFYR